MVPGSFNRNFQEIAVKIAAPTKNPKVHRTLTGKVQSQCVWKPGEMQCNHNPAIEQLPITNPRRSKEISH
jgi:hypothetical protein